MRASPRRSFARLSPLAVLVIAACAPPFDFNDRPPPCPDHYTLCDATGICLADGTPSATPDGGLPTGACPAAYAVRQGGTFLIHAPFARLDDIASVSSSSDVTAEPEVAADGSVGVLVRAQHGAILGALGVDLTNEREVTITSASGGKSATRHVKILVSPVAAVAPDLGGNDTNDGTLDSPFATFAKAASVARAGDTIYLRNGSASVPGVGNTADGAVVYLQDGVTVVGNDNTGTIVDEEAGQTELTMEIDLAGGATLSNITLDGHRLVVTTPGSQLTLQNCYIDDGITLDAKAGGEGADALPTNLHVYGGGLRNDGVILSPLWVAADGATVTIENAARIGSGVTNPATPTPAILFEGQGQTLTILDGAVVQSINGPAIDLSGPVHLYVNDATLEGGVEIPDPASMAQLIGATLSQAENIGEIHFGGAYLDVENGSFAGLAVVQSNMSHVKIRNSSVSNYAQVGYHLLTGTLDLGTESDPGNNVFKSLAPASGVLAQPTALIVESPLDGVAVTSSATAYDTVTPGMCELTAEHGLPGIVTITQAAKVDFF